MESKVFVLCPENFHGIPFQKYENDFTFIVNGKSYKTNRLVADILSPKIKQMHFTDPTNNEFYINFKENHEASNREDYFQDFLALAYYQKTKIDLDRQKKFLEYFYLLGNITEYVHLVDDQTKEIQVDNVIDRLISILSIERKMNEFTNIDVHSSEEIINFVASHFEDIDKEQLSKLDIEILDEIFKSDSLRINEEDTLLQFFISLYRKNVSYSFLFEYILFCNLSQKSLEIFVETVKFDHLNSPIWNSICERLLHPNITQERKSCFSETRKNQNGIKINFIEIHHKQNNEFHGIMNYLYEKTGSNIHENGTINITTNSVYNINYHPKNLVDYKNDALYWSEDKDDSYVCFDFNNFLIQLDCYSIKSQAGKDWTSDYNLKNWVLEVSNDKSEWIVVDHHENDNCLNGIGLISSFPINNDEFYRYVRIRITGQNWTKRDSRFSSKYAIRLNMIEFYGKLKRRT